MNEGTSERINELKITTGVQGGPLLKFKGLGLSLHSYPGLDAGDPASL